MARSLKAPRVGPSVRCLWYLCDQRDPICSFSAIPAIRANVRSLCWTQGTRRRRTLATNQDPCIEPKRPTGARQAASNRLCKLIRHARFGVKMLAALREDSMRASLTPIGDRHDLCLEMGPCRLANAVKCALWVRLLMKHCTNLVLLGVLRRSTRCK